MRKLSKISRYNNLVSYFSLFIIAIFIRGYFILSTNEVLNADESLMMLISKHISELRDFPIFHYGSSYLGTLDNYLSVIFIKIFGLNVISLRLTSVFLSLVLILVSIKLVKNILGETEGFIAGLYLSIPPLFMLMWNVRFFIGYLDILILGNIIYLILLDFVFKYDDLNTKGRISKISVMGFVSGIGLWCHFLFIVYIITFFIFLFFTVIYKKDSLKGILNLKYIFTYLFTFFTGVLPVLIFNLKHSNKNSLGFFSSQIKMYSNSLKNLTIGLYNFVFSNGLSLLGFSPPWKTFRPQFTVSLHKPVIIIFQSLLILFFLSIIYIFFLNKIRNNRLLRFIWILLMLSSVLTIVFMIYGYDWDKLMYPQRLFLEKLSLNFMLYEMTNLKILLYLIFILPVIFLMIIKKKQIADLFKNPTTSIKNSGIFLMVIHMLVLSLLYFLSTRALNRSPRFLFPIYTVLPFLVALIFKGLRKYSKVAAISFIIFLIGINLLVTISIKPINVYKPIPYVNIKRMPNSYKPIISFLLKKDIYNIYSFYWTGFPIVFNSKEKIYSVDRSSRIPEYKRRVEKSKKIAFVFWHTIGHWREFEGSLVKNKIHFVRSNIKGFLCYYDIDIIRLRKSPVWKDIRYIISIP